MTTHNYRIKLYPQLNELCFFHVKCDVMASSFKSSFCDRCLVLLFPDARSAGFEGERRHRFPDAGGAPQQLGGGQGGAEPHAVMPARNDVKLYVDLRIIDCSIIFTWLRRPQAWLCLFCLSLGQRRTSPPTEYSSTVFSLLLHCSSAILNRTLKAASLGCAPLGAATRQQEGGAQVDEAGAPQQNIQIEVSLLSMILK